MSIKKYIIKKFFPEYIRKGDVETKLNELSTESAIKRAKIRGTKINTVIDIGASDGRWSNAAMKIYPDANYFLIEANSEHEKNLINFKSNNNNVEYIRAAAGNVDGKLFFDNSDLWGGLASLEKMEHCIEVPAVKVDTCVLNYNLKGPFLLKLDTHGFEVPIFEGAIETLKNTSLIVVETYNFKINANSLKFYEMCSYMEEKGFGCIDISEPMHRKKDGSFWQIDLFFIPLTSEEFKYNGYE